jgi:uncharacterized protein YbjT (DUF2867 family)
MKKALVIGATGLVGFELTKQLLNDERFSDVSIFVRRQTGLVHPGLKEHVIDFDRPEDWKELIRGDVLFSALGTTLRKAGGKEAQYRVDYGYQYAFAQLAASQGVPACVLVSSAGADPAARAFYFRMKGELERDVADLPFGQLSVLRPGPLTGSRPEKRMGEAVGLFVVRMLNKLGLLRHFRPIAGETVARAMRNALFLQEVRTKIYGPAQLHDLAASGFPDKQSD